MTVRDEDLVRELGDRRDRGDGVVLLQVLVDQVEALAKENEELRGELMKLRAQERARLGLATDFEAASAGGDPWAS